MYNFYNTYIYTILNIKDKGIRLYLSDIFNCTRKYIVRNDNVKIHEG